MKIWKIKDLALNQQSPIQNHTIFSSDTYASISGSDKTVAIVGAGPKGFYGLQSLIGELQKEEFGEIDIHWFNSDHNFGNGSLFDLNQPEYLITNFAIGNIDLWKTSLCQECQTPNLTSWLKTKVKNPDKVKDSDFASRALVGLYYQDGLANIFASLPPSISLHLIKAKVTDIVPSQQGDKYQIILEGEHIQNSPQYDHVLVATGHAEKPVTNDGLARFGLVSLNAKYISNIYPVEKHLSSIDHLHKVGIRGMGLTFVDAVLALTEGKGGKFTSERNEMVYKPSGREPLCIYPFSLSGIPLCARPPKTTAKDPFIVNQGFVNELKAKKSRGNIDFEMDVLPSIEKELEIAYYTSWARRLGKSTIVHEEVNEIKAISTFKERLRKLEPKIPAFTLESFLDPFSETEETNATQYHEKVVAFMKKGLDELAIGTEKSPLLATMDVWANIMPYICQLYRFGGFTPASQQKFDEYYHPRFSKFAYGPPSIQIEKILSLCKAGILFFRLGRETEVSTRLLTGKYRLTSYQTHYCKEVDVLIDARMPRVDFHSNPGILYQNLLKRNLGKLFKNKGYVTGGMAVNESGNLISRKGQPTSNIFLNGNPTEGVTLDNDSLCKIRNDFSNSWAKKVVQHYKSPANFPLEK
ncbi:FAD/NAD(P)-binding protein [Pleomorphovibrio marinus]|uniref:FAD/NAD(P)-binding protein n=1 Tax=Pleomorphovibrio marinus TaxID=2164132 RepID=UPI001300BE6C|nr:FAD/NAD(P)-binding protein [Pleomorphovibrio marinus]